MNISLIGMMGAGKSTVGRILEQKLKTFALIDTDNEIIKRENISINEIFETKGEKYFRDIETEVLQAVLKSNNQIISTGGGIVCKDENIKLLKDKTICFYLKATASILFERVKNNKERPLLKVEDVESKINTLLSQRSCHYEEAHYIIDTDNKTCEEVADEIIGIINDSSRR